MKNQIINTVLIANRGEIASRIIRSCHKMGIRTIAVFSDADAGLPFVTEANVAVNIGAPEPAKSYLNQEKLLEIAKNYKADAIHPGYGFLSENPHFAKRCQQEKILFIGPNPAAISAMGLKSEAKSLMENHGVPVIPGYQGDDQSAARIKKEASKIGYPVLLKASAGGGGKGMRIVNSASEIAAAIEAAKREASTAFGNDELIIEKYISKGRHIEFQIFGDQYGNVIHILERECSIQRRYQKVIEESPSPVLSEKMRAEMGKSAVAAAQALNYDNAGTVEFIYDDDSGQYYFLEVNTRLQVEHPVTEEITGLDLVQMQIESAQGLPLQVTQQDIKGKGYAVEARLYAEDPQNNFLPVSGKIIDWQIPEVEGLRIETAVRKDAEISIYYDPMIAKIIVWDLDRHRAIRKLKYTLSNLVCIGITTNQKFLLDLVQHENFRNGIYDTHFINTHFEELTADELPLGKIHHAFIAATLHNWHKRKSTQKLLKGIPSGWRNNFYQAQKDSYLFKETEHVLEYRYSDNHFDIKIDKEEYSVKPLNFSADSIAFLINDERTTFRLQQNDNNIYTFNEATGQLKFELKEKFPSKKSEEAKGTYTAPMPSQVIKVAINVGDEVKEGEPLIILSSMKMENVINANESGVVTAVYVEKNSNIDAGQVLLKIDANDTDTPE